MVAILEEILVLSDVSFGGKCDLFHHGVVNDCLQENSFEFSKGKLFGIVGEFGEGGAALSCGITGNTNFYGGKIYIDGSEKTILDLINISWYVGNDIYGLKRNGFFPPRPKIKRRTIKEQIEQGVSERLTVSDYSTIQEMFQISNERIERNIAFLSGERWKASAAIGYAYGKQIFCFPWMNSKDFEHLKEQLTNIVNVLLDADCIVIMPTTKAENIEKVSDCGSIVLL